MVWAGSCREERSDEERRGGGERREEERRSSDEDDEEVVSSPPQSVALSEKESLGRLLPFPKIIFCSSFCCF